MPKAGDRRSLGAAVAGIAVASVLHDPVGADSVRLLSDEHFSVRGTQIQAWASMKSFRVKDGSSEAPDLGRNGQQLRGEKRSKCLDDRL